MKNTKTSFTGLYLLIIIMSTLSTCHSGHDQVCNGPLTPRGLSHSGDSECLSPPLLFSLGLSCLTQIASLILRLRHSSSLSIIHSVSCVPPCGPGPPNCVVLLPGGYVGVPNSLVVVVFHPFVFHIVTFLDV